MPTRSLKASPAVPSSPRTGGEGATLFRGQNFLLRGQAPHFYLEVYGGSQDLSETIASTALTGTLGLTASSKTVEGTGTSFLTELHPGQFILANGDLLVVDEIVSATRFIAARAATATVSGVTGYRCPVLFEMGNKRGSLLRGNAIEFDKGNILCVGDGVLRVNGSALQGSSLSASRSSKLAVYDPDTGDYSVYTLGMDTPATPTAAADSGGTKNMQAGVYSLIIVPARSETKGYNNPSNKVEVTLVTGERIRLSLPAMDTVNGQNAWRIYGSLVTPNQGLNGPWYYVRTITTDDVSAGGGNYYVEYLDAEIAVNELLTFNNDAPVDAEFIGTLSGYPVYVSCEGKGHSAASSTSPGPFIIPAKPRNFEAAPLEFAVSPSPPETIIGCVSALGRLYLLTYNTLQIAQFIDLPKQPITIRPFWKAGFTNPYQLIFINSTLYGMTTAGPTRSIADGDEGSEEQNFAADIEEISRTWVPNHVLVREDPQNSAVCFFHSADSLNSSGYWTTTIWMYMLKQRAWSLPIVLTSTTRDMIVSGVATVGRYLEFIAGGRVSGGSVEFKTYRFDVVTGEPVPAYAAWQFMDEGEELIDKEVGGLSVKGKLTSATAGVHGAGSGEAISTTILEAGNSGSKSGSIALGTLASVIVGEWKKLKVKGMALWTVRIDTTWSGSGTKDRLDECTVEVKRSGVRR